MAVALIVIVQIAVIAALLVQRARRARAERAVRESEERFRLIADRAPVLLWTSRSDSTLDYLNSTCVEFSGLPLQQLLGEGWLNVVHPDDRDGCARIYMPAVEARRPFQMDYRLRRADGVYRWALSLGLPKFAPDGRYLGFVGATIDITERKESEDALRDSQQRLTMATAAGALGIWDWNFVTGELFVDPGLKSLLGFGDAEISTRPDDWGSRVHPDDVPAAAALIAACVDGHSDVYEIEHRMLHKDGSVRWFLSRGSAVRGEDGTLQRMVGTKVDITERRLAAEQRQHVERENRDLLEQLQHLAGSLITAQDAERARIARDLHDDVSQQLAGLSIALSGLKRRVASLSQDGDAQAAVAAIQQRALSLAESVRTLSHDLHPDVLKHAGLTAALTEHCAGLSRSQPIAVSCSAEGDVESIDAETALCLYRIAQEALHNVVKHAAARQAQVRLFRTSHIAELTIADDGRGFDIGETRKSRKGLGLVSINERVRLAGGTLSVMTEWNKGTQIRVRLPTSASPDPDKVPEPVATVSLRQR